MNNTRALILGLFMISPFILCAKEIATDPHEVIRNAHLISIQYISIERSFLYPFIKKYIKEQAEKHSLFKQNYGYVSIREIGIENYSKAPLDITTNLNSIEDFWNTKILSFSLQLESHPFLIKDAMEGDCWQCSNYPLFFTVIDGRLIIIYDDALNTAFSLNSIKEYTRKSKKKLNKLVRPFLKKSLQLDFPFFHPLYSPQEFRLNASKRKKMTQHEIFKKAAFTLETAPETYFLLRNGEVLLETK